METYHWSWKNPSEATNLIPEGRLWDKVKRLEREKEELGKEKKRLTHEIDSKNEELTKLMAVMRSMHETSTRNTKRSEKLEADVKKIQQREENLKANIQLKEKEIESLKNQLALINEKIKKVCYMNHDKSLETTGHECFYSGTSDTANNTKPLSKKRTSRVPNVHVPIVLMHLLPRKRGQPPQTGWSQCGSSTVYVISHIYLHAEKSSKNSISNSKLERN